ncbi:gamma-glutamylcyclotransferase family protein [Sulfitobacter sp. HNIBRBA2951]|uniref:gamma-glutamylcyclotransferase family protein n=1 Tax=Sulfitobacter aquimarinus TaxID=3158557 RepID=UPI0032E001BF
MHPCFFGYGSLVNRDTHSYTAASRARLAGWRRRWVYTESRGLAFLSVVPDAHTSIDGLIAEVPNADWAALDAREYGYERIASGDSVTHPRDAATQVSHYSVPQHTWVAGADQHILLSYLDVVVQGYLREFGAGGVAEFFATTDGWDTTVLNDRAAPRYPRAQSLSTQETALVDQHMALRNVTITQG